MFYIGLVLTEDEVKEHNMVCAFCYSISAIKVGQFYLQRPKTVTLGLN